MPSKRQAAKSESPEPELPEGDLSEDDLDQLFASQQSSGSDELYQQRLRETLEKLQAAERAKKREQKEKKFLELAERQLKQDLTVPAKDLHEAMKEMEKVYQKFLVDYAVVEDIIHKKMDQITEEQDKLTKLIKDRQQHDEKGVKKASTMHVDGLSKMRTAKLAAEKVLNKMVLAPKVAER